MSNNILQWNPSQNSQESDGTYSTDTMRVSGAVQGSLSFSASLANKLFYQLSTVCSALGEMMSAKGYTISDSNISNLITTLSNIITKADNPISASLLGTNASGGIIDSSTLASNIYVIKPGMILPYPMSTVPSGFLECNGAIISRTTYSSLYSIIGTSYGIGNGSTTYGLPDYRGYFLRGWDHGIGVDPDSALRTDRGDGTNGDYVGTKQQDAFKSHVHYVYGTSAQDEMYGSYGFAGFGNIVGSNTQPTGGNETRPKNINVMWIIKY